MSDLRLERALQRLPEHMREDVRLWIGQGLPHPALMGGFFRAVLMNDLVEAFAFADDENARAMKAWAQWLYNDCPTPAWSRRGLLGALQEWHKRGGMKGIDNA
jgi:hypothetical protein